MDDLKEFGFEPLPKEKEAEGLSEFGFEPLQDDKISPLQIGALGAVQGATFDFGDEIYGGVAGALDTASDVVTGDTKLEDTLSKFKEKYKTRRDDARETIEKAREQSDGEFFTGEMIGALGSAALTGGFGGIGSVGKVAGNRALKAALPRMVATGAIQGAATAAGQAEELENIPSDVASGASIGGVLGGVVPGGLKVAGETAKATGRAVKSTAKSLGLDKNILSRLSGLSEEVVDTVLSDPALVRNAPDKALKSSAKNLVNVANKTNDEAIEISQKGYNVLNDKKQIDAIQILGKIEDIATQTGINEEGLNTLKKTAKEISKKSSLDIASGSRLVSDRDIKDVVKQLHDVAYKSEGKGQEKLRSAATKLNNGLKERNPEYAEYMLQSSKKFKFLEELQGLFGIKDTGAVNFLPEEMAISSQKLDFSKANLDTAMNKLKGILDPNKAAVEDFIEKGQLAGMLDPNLVKQIKASVASDAMKKSSKMGSGDLLGTRAMLAAATGGLIAGGPLGAIATLGTALAIKPTSRLALKNADKIKNVVKKVQESKTKKAVDKFANLSKLTAVEGGTTTKIRSRVREENTISQEDAGELLPKVEGTPFERDIVSMSENENDRDRMVQYNMLRQQPAFREMLKRIKK